MTTFTLTATKTNLSDLLGGGGAGYNLSRLTMDGSLSLTISNRGSQDVYVTTPTSTPYKTVAGNGSELGITIPENTAQTIELRNANAVELSSDGTNTSVEILAI